MEVINAIGRRKSAVARVYLSEGTGKITINKKDIKDFFPSAILQYVVKQPLELLEVAEKYDIKDSLLATAVLLSVRSQVSQRLVVASSSASVNVFVSFWLAVHGQKMLRKQCALCIAVGETHKLIV